ncbi:MAG: hypothetical protein IPP71_22060 [Bacteroidetes bacterium]|nr:hypothetical protein [Bacteroidota bacterium]
MKTDFDGTVQWSKKYGGTNNEEAYSITPTFDGGFVMAGSTTTFTGPPLNGPSNVYLIKVNDSGDLQWSQSISVSAHDVAFSVKETFDHGFILTGATDGFSTATSELFLVKTDSSGITEWIRSFETIGYSHGKGQNVIQTRDSGFAVVGYESGIGDTSIYLITTTSTGLILNTLKYTIITNQNLLQTYGYDIIQNNSGNLIITGAVGGFYGGLFFTYSPFLLETDSSGIYVASRYYSLNSGDCRSYSVKQTNDGGYIIGGVMGIIIR